MAGQSGIVNAAAGGDWYYSSMADADTIVALSSALPGQGGAGPPGRAILRLSGPRAFAVAAAVFSAAEAGRARRRGWRRVEGHVNWRGHRLEACAYFMPAPYSFTREDVVELHVPAVRPVLAETLAALQRAGARAALPGEFTRRALLNGRLSLAQAEAVGAQIRAQTADEARRWAARTAGTQAGRHSRLRAGLEDLLAEVEAGLDFSHEELELLPRSELARRLGTLLRVAEAAASSRGDEDAGLLLGGDPRVVLAGPTNAGKSTLFNALLGRPAAIVSEEPHTTRDPVEADWEPEAGLRVLLVDTGGLETIAGDDPLLPAVQAATRRAVRSADVLLVTLDRSVLPEAARLAQILERVLQGCEPPVVGLVWTKCDLPAASAWAAEAKALEAGLARLPRARAPAALCVAALTGEGLENLRVLLARESAALRGRMAGAWATCETAARDGAARALAALRQADAALRESLGEDAVAAELRAAVHALSDAQGILLRHDSLTESLLDRIFSRFCVGK